MFEEGFAAGYSALHRLDPRVKIVAAMLLSAVTALAARPVTYWTALAAAALLCAIARLPARLLAVRLAAVNGFILFLWLFVPFTVPGETLLHAGPLTATAEGVSIALAVTVKSNAIILTSIALLSTSTIFSLVHAMNHMYFPPKLIHMFFFTFRYAHVLSLEYARLKNAMKVRCFVPRTNMHTYRSYAYLAGMLLVNSYDRSERVFNAMKCRGFRGEYRVLRHFEMSPGDIAAAALLLALAALLAAVETSALWP